MRGGKSRQPRGAGAFPGGTRHLREAGEGYTEKQWGRDCKDLPASIIKRLPLRFTYDNNYFNDRCQGIPMGGYTAMVERMFGDTDTLLDTEYKEFIAEHDGIADRVIYCGPIDEYFDYKLGTLEYRSLRFETEKLECENWQGNAVVNYTERARCPSRASSNTSTSSSDATRRGRAFPRR